VAIAKNEGRYIQEWLAFHLSIGFNRVLIYDNDSTDGMAELVRPLAARFPVEVIDWPGADRRSPQRDAYKESLIRIEDCDWVLYIDIDEFVVPWGFQDIQDYVSRIPGDVGSVALNWRIFGSSGRQDAQYDSVLRCFTRAAVEASSYQRFFKSLSRVGHILEPHVHHVVLSDGRRVLSDFSTLIMPRDGAAERPVYSGIQVNHYQTKTRAEFERRMTHGNANRPPSHPNLRMNDIDIRFTKLDRNEVEDRRVDRFIGRAEMIRAAFAT
jgi:hypothetical protein